MTESADQFAPGGLRTGGTVIVVPGRGESPATYARFGSRLAFDAYRVRVIGPPAAGAAKATAFLAELPSNCPRRLTAWPATRLTG
jgi:alpha-beta hydrolase superfamily lysophospholipase